LRLQVLLATTRRAQLRMMSGIPPAASSLAFMAGAAGTREELLACKIGGCCGKDTPLLSADAVAARMPALSDWALSADGKAISKDFVAKDWAAAVGYSP